MATLSKGHTFSGGETVTAAKLNSLVDSATISGIVNSEIDASAAIALSKLATGALPTGITVASANIVDGTIVNSDISAAASIAGTKIAPDFGSQNITTSGSANINRPSDHWAVGGVFVVGGATRLGQLDTHGAFEVTLTSNGYRDNTAGTNLWKSYGANSQTGAAQIGVNPAGNILFRTEATKATGSSNVVTERMRITSSGNVGIGTTAPLSTNGGLDIASGGLGLVLGAESGSIQRSNNTAKLGRIVCPHYTNAEEPVGGIIVSSESGGNTVTIGGGSVLTNAATEINFRTASNNTTTVGTIRLLIDSSGNVGVGTTTPNAAALLDVSSTTKGFLPPRMTTAQRDAISTPPAGLAVYNTTTNKLNFYNGAAWEAVTSS